MHEKERCATPSDDSFEIEVSSGGLQSGFMIESLRASKSDSNDSQPEFKSPLQNLSTLRLLSTHLGAALALFLATTDANIVSTSLPTIARDLHANQIQYTWVGVAYMLTQTAFQPLYGRISDLVGRMTVLYSSMAIFSLGSVLCGAAQTINWLISARSLAGIGAGGIVSSVWVLTAEIVPMESRAKWSQALSLTWSCSAVAGPIFGGIFSGANGSNLVSWRWSFFLNLPICLTALAILIPSLHNVHVKAPNNTSWRTLAQSFDFGGLVLFMSGSGCIVVGLSFASINGWTSPATLSLIVLGPSILVGGGFYERYTSRQCLFPPSTFRESTTVIILLITFLHSLAFTAGTFYLALYQQAANGATPLEAGLRVLPYALGSSLASMPAAWFIGYWQKRSGDTSGQNLVISIGLSISTAGFGLLMLLDAETPLVTQVIFPLVSGIGLGMLFHAPYQVFTRTLKLNEIAAGTSAFFLIRFTGATTGLAVAGAVFYAQASHRLPPNLPINESSSSIEYSLLRTIEPLTLRLEVLDIISSSIQAVWIVCTPCLGFALLLSFFLRKLSMQNEGNDITSKASQKEQGT